MKIVFHPEAYEEMIESAGFYEHRDDGLGLRFLEAVERTTQRIRDCLSSRLLPLDAKGRVTTFSFAIAAYPNFTRSSGKYRSKADLTQFPHSTAALIANIVGIQEARSASSGIHGKAPDR